MAKRERPPLERAARALCSLAGNPENATMDGKPLWQSYLPEARAVLQAIREPSEAMLSASWIPASVEGLNKEHRGRMASREAWQAMIDAALGTETN